MKKRKFLELANIILFEYSSSNNTRRRNYYTHAHEKPNSSTQPAIPQTTSHLANLFPHPFRTRGFSTLKLVYNLGIPHSSKKSACYDPTCSSYALASSTKIKTKVLHHSSIGNANCIKMSTTLVR